MIAFIRKHIVRFRRDEDGQMMIEFVIMVPLIFTLFLTSVELGIYAMRQMFLDRGLDMSVRIVRLGTGATPQHDELKEIICNFSGFIPDCENSIKLEMAPIDPRNFSNIPAGPDCVDRSEEVAPARTFSAGGDHELMIMRACIKFDPIFPSNGLGKYFAKDSAGQVAMVALSAFVQEPR